MDPTDQTIDWWRKELFLILDHYVIATKDAEILRTPSYKFQKVLEEFIESVMAGDESFSAPTAERPISHTND